MKLIWLSSLLLSATLSAQADIEMIAMGFALRDSVMVYADSTQSAKAAGQLRFAEYVTVIGLQENGKAQFNRSGWCRIERRGGGKGWMRYADLAVGDHVGFFFAMGDSVFDRPDSRAKFKWKFEMGSLQRCTMRASERGQVWLGDHRGWLRVRKFEPSLGDAYYKLMAA